MAGLPSFSYIVLALRLAECVDTHTIIISARTGFNEDETSQDHSDELVYRSDHGVLLPAIVGGRARL